MSGQKTAVLFWILLFCAGCATIPPVQKQIIPPNGISHIVARGETLYGISKIYGVDINEIMRLNNITDPRQLEQGSPLLIPKAAPSLYIKPYELKSLESVKRVVGKTQYKVRWKTITLHHSATSKGNAEMFNRNHRHRGMGGLFYHFVLGNGSNSNDGQVEAGWRWKRQVEANRRGDIQICLVGNFNKQEVSQAQFNSLIQLLRVLMTQYSIPASRVRRHKDIPGRNSECPGSRFPYVRIMQELRLSP